MIRIRRVAAPDPALLEPLCALLIDAVDGGASIGFLAPLSPERAVDYWNPILEATTHGHGLWVAEDDDGTVVGSVQCDPCRKENGRHRAEVQKLFVLRARRGQGIARRLLETLEEAARAEGRTLLVLDTEEGSAAEGLYARLGWQRCGAIPDYATRPDGVLHPTVLYCRRL